MSRSGRPLLRKLSGSPSFNSSVDMGSDFPLFNEPEDHDEEEDVEIKISASGSVLTPSPNPYDKTQKLKQANAQLMAAELPPRPPAKVRFNDAVITAQEDEEGLQNIRGVETLKTSPGKMLLVTVPTGFSEDLEEMNSDEEVIDETVQPPEPEENVEDCLSPISNTKKVISFQDYSVDMKSVDDDDAVEDLTTTLVSLCRMTSECDDTSLENNISKYGKIASEHNNEDLIELNEDDESQNSIEKEEEIEPLDDNISDSDGCLENVEPLQQEVEIPSEPVTIKIIKRPSSASTMPTNQEAVRNNENDSRPSTSPGKRVCFKNQWAHAKLPSYNGLRSEYGLSAEQLQERKKKRLEHAKQQKQQKEEQFKEEKRRQKENEQMFATWLVKKKKEAAMKAARRKQLQSAFHFKTLPAPTSHLEKMGVLRKKVLARREHTCYSLEEFFKNAKPHEQKTYKIYLGLCVE